MVPGMAPPYLVLPLFHCPRCATAHFCATDAIRPQFDVCEQIPIAVVVTKIDICPPTVLKQTRQALAKYLRSNQKMPYPIKDVSQASRWWPGSRFTTSRGRGLTLVTKSLLWLGFLAVAVFSQ